MTFDFEWAELPDDIAQAKHQAWQQWETIDDQLHHPTHPPQPDDVDELERQQRAAWKQYWHADGARYHLSNRQLGDAITVMEQVGMARQVPTPPFPQPATYGTSSDDYDTYLDAVDRGDTVEPSPALAASLDARAQHLAANFGETCPVSMKLIWSRPVDQGGRGHRQTRCLIESGPSGPFSRWCLTEPGPPWPFSRWRLRSSENGQRGSTSMRQP